MIYKKESEYFELEYTEKDKEYIDELFGYVEREARDIVMFFNLENFGDKVSAKLFDDLDSFRNVCSEFWKNRKVPMWLCGFAFHKKGKNYIYSLCLEEYRKTEEHTNCTLENLKRLITHEFVHACHSKYSNIKLPIWLGEGLATYLSHQFDNQKLSFNASLDDVINGGVGFKNYYTMFSYVLNNYGKHYILSLLKDEEFLKEETVKLYNEVSSFYKNKSR